MLVTKSTASFEKICVTCCSVFNAWLLSTSEQLVESASGCVMWRDVCEQICFNAFISSAGNKEETCFTSIIFAACARRSPLSHVVHH